VEDSTHKKSAGDLVVVHCGEWLCHFPVLTLPNPDGLSAEEIEQRWRCGEGHPLKVRNPDYIAPLKRD